MQTHELGMSCDQNLAFDIWYITAISFTIVCEQIDYSYTTLSENSPHYQGLGQNKDDLDITVL